METRKMTLAECRSRIDEIDEQILALYRRRMAVAAEVARCKSATGKPLFDPVRERDILDRIGSEAGPELAGGAKLLFSTLFSVSRSLQRKLLHRGEGALGKTISGALARRCRELPEGASVACCGIPGAYGFQAAARCLRNPEIIGCTTFSGVADELLAGRCRYGVLPIENSSRGTVKQVYELLCGNGFKIVRSARLQIRHALLAKPGVPLEAIREVISHEQALGQCANWLREHHLTRLTKCDNTAFAAREVAGSDDPGVAAIASAECAPLYGLKALAENIQDFTRNETRFICVGRELEILPDADRISLMLTLPHRPGELSRLISRFAALDLNLAKLESLPRPGSDFEFDFCFDFEASPGRAEVRRLLDDLAEETADFNFLGAYTVI